MRFLIINKGVTGVKIANFRNQRIRKISVKNKRQTHKMHTVSLNFSKINSSNISLSNLEEEKEQNLFNKSSFIKNKTPKNYKNG
mmetsp:Transcript_25839/g.22903  ORF Transcript_25839/g.22903 Transcript_25839/m.22903 type:complete len:84 (+) Transcript_25839:51-302(+)